VSNQVGNTTLEAPLPLETRPRTVGPDLPSMSRADIESTMLSIATGATNPGAQPTDVEGIVRNPRIFGGKPIIGLHRISVHDVAAHIRQGYTPEQIASDEIYPTLTLEEVYAALRYYERHKEVIDWEIVRETAELKRRAQEDTSPFAQMLRQRIKELRAQRGES
jgi:uncharacterized protein (DUF433 family)